MVVSMMPGVAQRVRFAGLSDAHFGRLRGRRRD